MHARKAIRARADDRSSSSVVASSSESSSSLRAQLDNTGNGVPPSCVADRRRRHRCRGWIYPQPPRDDGDVTGIMATRNVLSTYPTKNENNNNNNPRTHTPQISPSPSHSLSLSSVPSSFPSP